MRPINNYWLTSPTHHYSDTFRLRIKPGLSIYCAGNPCGGDHRVTWGWGECKQKAAASSLQTATSLCCSSCGEQWHSSLWSRTKMLCSLVIPYLWHRIWDGDGFCWHAAPPKVAEEGDRRAEWLFWVSGVKSQTHFPLIISCFLRFLIYSWWKSISCGCALHFWSYLLFDVAYLIFPVITGQM